jgi:hypothetical protein
VATGIGYQNDILEKNRRNIKRDKKRHQKIRRRKGIVQHKKYRISSVDIVWARCKNGDEIYTKKAWQASRQGKRPKGDADILEKKGCRRF